MKVEAIYDRVLAIQEEAAYDEKPSYAEALRKLNDVTAHATGLLEILHPLIETRDGWWYCRRTDGSGQPCCPVQCRVCLEDQARLRTRAKGSVPK